MAVVSGAGGRAPLVVVLGASGPIGTVLVREWARRPLRLRAVARRPTPVPGGHVAEVDVRTVDLSAEGQVAGLVAGADVVVHLVAPTDLGWRAARGDAAASRIGTGLVHELIAAVRAEGCAAAPPLVLFAGSTSQAGPPDGGGSRERRASSETVRENPYERQKSAAERALFAAAADGVLRAVSLRLPTVYGHAGSPAAVDRGVLSTMARRALDGEPLTLWHDGTVRRDFLHLDDVAAAFLRAAECGGALSGRAWPIGSGLAVPLSTAFRLVADAVAEHTSSPPVPVVSVPPPADAGPADLRSAASDPSAFRRVTDWAPEVPLGQGLVRTVAALAAERNPRGRPAAYGPRR